MKTSTSLLALALLLATPAATWADSKTVYENRQGNVRVVLSDSERAVIRDYYSEHPESTGKKPKQIPPGLKKKAARDGELPPGWQKKMARGEVVDEGVWAYRQALPEEVIHRLPPSPRGVITIRIEGKVVRAVEATREILDVFDLY